MQHVPRADRGSHQRHGGHLVRVSEYDRGDQDREKCERELEAIFKAKIGCTPEAKGVPIGELPRSEKKTKRIFDSRY